MSRLPFHSLAVSLAASLALPLVACVDGDLPPGSFIDRDRVVGARIEVVGDVERASPLPGETVAVRWIMADPAAQSRTWTLGVCAGTHAGCAAEPMLVESGTGFEPSLTFVAPMPDAAAPNAPAPEASSPDGAAPEAPAPGASTPDAPAPDAPVIAGIDRLWIAGEIDSSKVVATVPLAFDGIEHANRNPSLADASLSIGDTPWPSALAPENCANLPLLRVADGEVELAITVDGTDREIYSTRADDGATRTHREHLQLSHFTTVGTLDRQFSVVDGDDTVVRVNWIAPVDLDIPATGLVARFVIVVRDGRGGLDTTTRFACVTT